MPTTNDLAGDPLSASDRPSKQVPAGSKIGLWLLTITMAALAAGLLRDLVAALLR
ncbi:MAG: hypothetical protein L0Y71_04220 [Gemmataceae bacterium]|nr:hypothetical protein [Gemmataceae bacterium]